MRIESYGLLVFSALRHHALRHHAFESVPSVLVYRLAEHRIAASVGRAAERAAQLSTP